MNRAECLDTAKEIVHADRASDYGAPEDNFGDIGAFWTTYLRKKLKPDSQISTADVAIMSAMIKVSRIMNTPDHEDSWVDIAGYAACGVQCATESGEITSVLDLAKRMAPAGIIIPPGFVWHNNRLVPEAEMEGVEGYDRRALRPGVKLEEW